MKDGADLMHDDLPLFMLHHTVVSNSSTIPREGVDFVYDEFEQKAIWFNEGATNKWSKTSYSDTKIDGVDF